MRKIEDFETFAAGYFLGLGIKNADRRGHLQAQR